MAERRRAQNKDSVIFAPKQCEAKTHIQDTIPVVCCVDDTDDLSGATSTGYVAECIARKVVELGGTIIHGITRHQLLLAEGVPYTSHNSSMAFMALINPELLNDLENEAFQIIQEQKAETSDPGFCIFQCLGETDGLLNFGQRAQNEILAKSDAYNLAKNTPGMRLSEHGGTGDGVIGALAGVGLRLGGHDGRFRGSWNTQEICEAKELALSDFRNTMASKVNGPVLVIDAQGEPIDAEANVVLASDTKPLLRHGALCFQAAVVGGKILMEETENPAPGQRRKERLAPKAGTPVAPDESCAFFAFDNDIEECAPALQETCENCLYRRNTLDALLCVR